MLSRRLTRTSPRRRAREAPPVDGELERGRLAVEFRDSPRDSGEQLLLLEEIHSAKDDNDHDNGSPHPSVTHSPRVPGTCHMTILIAAHLGKRRCSRECHRCRGHWKYPSHGRLPIFDVQLHDDFGILAAAAACRPAAQPQGQGSASTAACAIGKHGRGRTRVALRAACGPGCTPPCGCDPTSCCPEAATAPGLPSLRPVRDPDRAALLKLRLCPTCGKPATDRRAAAVLNGGCQSLPGSGSLLVQMS